MTDIHDSPTVAVALLPSESPDKLVSIAELAEKLRFDRIMFADGGGVDTYSIQAICAHSTRRIQIGTSVTNPFLRHPAVTATAIATIDNISNGRAVLGIGTGTAPNGLFRQGENRDQRVLALREAILIIRKILSGKICTFSGKHFAVERFKSLAVDQPKSIPILVASRGPLTERLAGELADIAMISVTSISRENFRRHLANVEAGARKSNRRIGDIHRIPHIYTCCSEDGQSARRSAKIFAGSALVFNMKTDTVGPELISNGRELVGRIEAQLAKIRGHYALQYKLPSALDELVNDEIVDQFTIAGTPEQCAARIDEVLSYGFDGIELYIVPILGKRERYLGYLETLKSLGKALPAKK